MEEVIKQWKEFMIVWDELYPGGILVPKPEFYDFMEYLAANSNERTVPKPPNQ